MVGRVRYEVSVPATPSEFVIELHRHIDATRPKLPIDLSRLGTVVEIWFTDDDEYEGTKVVLHMARNSAGTVVSLEAASDGYAQDMVVVVEKLMRQCEDTLRAKSRAHRAR
jgi:hypothetical protein